MHAKLTLQGDVTVVSLIGRMEIESAYHFGQACRKQFNNGKIVFNLRSVSFVGSSGITPYLISLKELSEANKNIKVSCVSQDLRRMFDAYNLGHLEFFSTDQDAVNSFVQL